MSVSPEKEQEYQQLLDDFRSGKMTEDDIDERIRDDISFARFVFKSMKMAELEPQR